MKKRWWFLVISMLLLAAFLFAYPYADKINRYRTMAREIAAGSKVEDFVCDAVTTVYDYRGEELFTYSDGNEMQYVEYGQIPQMLVNSFVVMEDRKFFEHEGIDVYAMIRAVLANRNAGGIVQGASTITQQLARNVYLTQEVSYERKLVEVFLAMELEKKYTKEQIIEFYLNNIYFGNGYYGVAAAAKGYFNKEVSALTTGECILLSAIPNNPTRYNPLENIEAAVERAKLITSVLYQEEKIDEITYMMYYYDTSSNPFGDIYQNNENDTENNFTTADTYVRTYVTYCAIRTFMESQGFVFKNDFQTEEEKAEYEEQYEAWYDYCQSQLYAKGLSIYTSINMDMQRKLQGYIDANVYAGDAGYENNSLEGAGVVIDNGTGYVVAIVGGKTQEAHSYGLNRAYQSYRQPGSAIKPLNVYTPYLMYGHTPEETVEDVYNPEGPRNAGGVYSGTITLREAVKTSKNTVAWNIYNEITTVTGTEFLIKLGFKKVYMDKMYDACALGGFTYGVSCEEMAAGFYTLQNGGNYRTPTCIIAIMGDGVSVYNELREVTQVYTKEATDKMTSMLCSVVEEGTGRRVYEETQCFAGKTGTTNSNKDMWFAGYSAYYTAAVWVGYDMPAEIISDSGNIACDIWRDFMVDIHQGLNRVELDVYQEMETQMPVEEETQEESTDMSLPEGMIIYDNDEKASLEWDENASVSGDESASTGGDENASVSGDENASLAGDEDASMRGDEDAVINIWE